MDDSQREALLAADTPPRSDDLRDKMSLRSYMGLLGEWANRRGMTREEAMELIVETWPEERRQLHEDMKQRLPKPGAPEGMSEEDWEAWTNTPGDLEVLRQRREQG